jgi:Bacterial RNA polymerase, alpha chain C terminal domain
MTRISDDTLVDDISVSVRTRRLIYENGCQSVGDIRRLGRVNFERTPGFGKKSVTELTEVIGGWPPHPAHIETVPVIDLSEITTAQLLQELWRRHAS